MKKKCFNAKFGQTESVLNGQKTMFREIYKCPSIWNGIRLSVCKSSFDGLGNMSIYLVDEDGIEIDSSHTRPKYAFGEVVAVAQKYGDLNKIPPLLVCPMMNSKGWNSKLLVKADLMPHQIEITGIKLERLQDISDEDCIKEGIGIRKYGDGSEQYISPHNLDNGYYIITDNIKETFSFYINQLFGKETWEQNPYVIAYEFELIK